MLTPQKKLWSSWSLPGPASQNKIETLEKQSNVLLDQECINVLSQENDEENMMNMRQKLSELENELYDYQYQMGLLLIEKKKWISDYAKLQHAFAETKDTLDRKQADIYDMQKALHKMHSRHAEIKFTSDLKLVEANALVTGIRDKSLVADSKLRAADARDVDLSRKNSEIERILRRKEDDINERVEELSFREKESDAMRKSVENDLRSKVLEVEKKVDIVNGMEEKVSNCEHELDRKNKRLKKREKNFESKFKDLEKWENSLSVEEKKMEDEKEKLILEEEKLFILRAEIEKSRDHMGEERQRMKNESENLKLTEEERVAHSLLQLELKQEIDKCKSERERLLKKREDLKQERDQFENEWEVLDEKIRLSEIERDKDIEEINYLKEVVGNEMRLESSRIEHEKEEMLANQRHLDEQQLEMRKSNDELVNLSYKLKELREQVFREKEHFLTFVEKHKSCKNCGDSFPESVCSDHQSIASTGTMSWIQKCTSKILTLSSGNKNDPAYTNQDFSRKNVIESPPERLFSTDDDSDLQFGLEEDNLDLKNMQANDNSPAVNEQSKSSGEAHNVVEGSQHPDQNLDPPKRRKRGRDKANMGSTVKTAVTDVKLIRENAPELNKNEHNKLNQAGKKMQRKWTHSGASWRKRSDSDHTYSGGDSDSENSGGRRKKRHNVVPPVQTTSGQCYNFRKT